MAAHARLKTEFTEDEKCHNLMSWPIWVVMTCINLWFSQDPQLQEQRWCKNPKNLDTQKNCSDYSKILKVWFYRPVMHPKDADKLAHIVYTLIRQSDLGLLSVQILKDHYAIMVYCTMPVCASFTLILTSPALGGPTSIVSMDRGFLGSQATAARHVIGWNKTRQQILSFIYLKIFQWIMPLLWDKMKPK